jgi:transposase InsO family protein
VKKSQIFAVIGKLKDKYSVEAMCKFYCVSRQGYYDWTVRQEEPNPDAALIEMIKECQRKNKNRLGYRRVQKWLKREKGLTVNHKKILRITSRNNLLSAIRRRKVTKYKPNGNLKYENVLNRKTHSDTPNTDWVTDISYIIMPDGTAYLSAIRDL